MVITGIKGVYSIGGLSKTQLDVIMEIVLTVDRRYFNEQDADGVWYSNDDFVVWLSDEERKALTELGEAITCFTN